jgi:CheY-like chemotaxis protein
MSDRALVFSSDNNAARVLRETLVEAGLSVDSCTDAAGLVESLANEKFVVVVVDTSNTRERDGILQQLRCTPLNKEALAVVVLSTQAHATSVFSLGANFLVYRPVSADRVRSSIRAATRLIHREKRRNKRESVHAEANLSCAAVESAPATLLDLSNDGLSLQCERGLPAQSKIYLRFTLPGQVKSVQLSGETMWQDSMGRVGLRFVDVPQVARRQLKEWLDFKLSIRESKVRVELPGGQSGTSSKSASDRRSESRHTCRLGAEVYRAGTKIPHHCALTDISVGGFYVEMPTPFSVGAPVEVVVRTGDFKFTSAGTVQKMDRGFGMGVAFDTQTAVQHAQVLELIKIAFRDREAEGDPVLNL